MASQRLLIQPSIPPIPGYMELSPLDQLATKAILPLILAFETPPTARKSQILWELQSALAVLIEEMPFLMANVVVENADRDSLQLEIPTEDAGVWFHSRELPEFSFKELKNRGFPSCELQIGDFVPHPFLISHTSPVLTIQANFITGGLLIAVNMHHSVMDGAAFAYCLTRWGMHIKAFSEGRVVPAQDSVPAEALDRSVLFGGHSQTHITDFPSYRAAKNGFRKDPVDMMLVQRALLLQNRQESSTLPKLDLFGWRFTTQALSKLEKAVAPPSEDLPRLTESAILSALLWRHVTRARRLRARGITSTTLLFPIDVRLRIDPPLPAEYTGNAIVYGKATASVQEIESSSPEMLYELARRVTEATDWWTPHRVWELLGSIDACEYLRGVETAGDMFLGPDIDFSNVAGLRLRNFHWGPSLGEPKGVRLPYAPVREGHATILPRTGDGLEMTMMMERDIIMRLMEDKEWTQWAKVAWEDTGLEATKITM
jgi:trichothecene 3-O-acetyltransferase